MSRFNNLNAVFAPARDRAAGPQQIPVPKVPSPPARPSPGTRPAVKPVASLILPPSPADTSIGQALGFLALCIYLVSGYANEFAIRALGTKAYVSTAILPVLPVVLLISGNIFRGLRDTTGRLWIAFMVWMCLTVPFSMWKGGTVLLMRDYVSRSWIEFFLITAFAVSLRHCRWMIGVMIGSSVLLLIDCGVAARISLGRLDIPGSLFFANANDLSLQLLLAITQFFYLFFQTGIFPRVLAVAGISAAMVYNIQTGSRGGAIAMLVLMAVVFVVGNQRVLVAAVVVLAGVVALAVVPMAAFHRISLIAGDDVATTDSLDSSAMGSQTERLQLLRQSIELTLTHPLVGVGPGQFAVAVEGEAQKNGQRSAWLGTHNSYTEISSECGIPAFLLYTSVLFLSVWSNLRMFQRSSKNPKLRQVSALAFSTFCGCVVYAVATFFAHIAYTGYLPILAGITAALRLTTDRSLWGSRGVQYIAPAQRVQQPLAKGVA